MTNQNNSKTQTIVVPKEWKGKEILIRRYNDTIVIKKIETPEFWKSWEKIKAFCKDVSKKEIEKAIQWAKKSSK